MSKTMWIHLFSIYHVKKHVNSYVFLIYHVKNHVNSFVFYISCQKACKLICFPIYQVFSLSCHGYEHGRRVYGRLFFSGTRPDYYSWGQPSGINAGVMLLHPNTEIIEQMLSEATYMFLCMRITRRPLRGLLQDFVWHSFRSCRIKFNTFIRSINNKICDALELFKCSGINSKHS